MNLFKFPTGEAHCKLDGGDALLHVPMQPNVNDYLMTVLLACEANHRAPMAAPRAGGWIGTSRNSRPIVNADQSGSVVIDSLAEPAFSGILPPDLRGVAEVAQG